MATEYSVIFTANYNQTDFTRTYELSNVDSLAADINTVRTKVDNINASLAAGTADQIANLFVADDFDSSDGTGKLSKLSNLKVKETTEVFIQPTTKQNPIISEEELFNTDNENNSDEMR